MAKQKVLIVGGGFGGIKTAQDLAKHGTDHYDITLISEQPDFRYYPSFYRAATGGSLSGSRLPLHELFDKDSIRIIQGTAVSLDRTTKTLQLADGSSHPYDILVLGLGVITNYFGIPGMQDYSYSIKSFPEIKRFKDHLHQQIEDDRRPDLNYVIVGAGPTGIELAGALPDYLRFIMDNHGVRHKSIHIDLIEAAPRLLPRMPKPVSRTVERRLRALGVKIFKGKAVQGIAADQLTLSGKPILSHTVVWTAGVTNHPFFKDNGFMLTPRGKVATDMYLQAEDNLFVIGDNANTPYSGMAQTALRDGQYVANTLLRRAEGHDPKSYVVKKPITVIPAGERWAAVIWGKAFLSGIIGWVLRESADLVAFADYEPWWKAGRQWLAGLQDEETCEVCLAAEHRSMVDK